MTIVHKCHNCHKYKWEGRAPARPKRAVAQERDPPKLIFEICEQLSQLRFVNIHKGYHHLHSFARTAGNHPPNLNFQTIFSVSVAMEPVIFDWPARRSVNVMGISFSYRPALAMRKFISIGNE